MSDKEIYELEIYSNSGNLAVFEQFETEEEARSYSSSNQGGLYRELFRVDKDRYKTKIDLD
jgi:hypothetical protein